MFLGWRQTIRNGKHKNDLIEDIGIISDFILRPTSLDFNLNRSKKRQLDEIASYFRQLKDDGRRHTYCILH